MKARTRGLTILELVVVMAIIGILATVGVVAGNAIARRQSAQGAVATFQQSVWQGATAAASRGITVELRRSGDDLVLVDVEDDRTLRRYQLPSGVDIPVENPILRFLPPGKVDLQTLEGLEGLVIDTGEGRYALDISLIGEVRSSKVGDG